MHFRQRVSLPFASIDSFLLLLYISGPDPGFAKGGGRERAKRVPITGSGAEPSAGSRGSATSRGRAPVGGRGSS